MTDGRTDGRRDDFATRLRNFAPKRLLRHYNTATRVGTKSGTWVRCLYALRERGARDRDQTDALRRESSRARVHGEHSI